MCLVLELYQKFFDFTLKDKSAQIQSAEPPSKKK